jgi:hypothetical protein
MTAVGLGRVITRPGRVLNDVARRGREAICQAAMAAIIGLMPTMFMARVRL